MHDEYLFILEEFDSACTRTMGTTGMEKLTTITRG
jgi:hypothetical protein